MTRRKKRAWNMSNPLYRYLHGGARRKKTRAKRSYTMARRRRFGRRSRGRGSGGGIFNRGILGKMGPSVMGLSLLGLGIGYFSPEISAMVPVNIPYKQPVVAALGGGIVPGLAGMFLRNMTSGGTSSTNAPGAF